MIIVMLHGQMNTGCLLSTTKKAGSIGNISDRENTIEITIDLRYTDTPEIDL